MQPVSRGSQPTDGGNLVIENDVLENFLADPITAKYIRPFRGSRELMNGLSRWCLWMADDLDPADLEKSKLLSDRILAVRSMRQSSKKKQLKKQQGLPIFFKR